MKPNARKTLDRFTAQKSEHTEFEANASEMQVFNTSAKKSVFDSKGKTFEVPEFNMNNAKFPKYINSCAPRKQFGMVLEEEESIESSSTQMLKVIEMPDLSRNPLNI